MNTLLLIIDLQKDFINHNTKDIIEPIENLILQNKFDKIVFTRFINSKDNICFKRLNYLGCMDEEGQKIVINTNNNKIIDKKIYSALNNELIEYIENNNISKIYLCGIDTECCVLKTAFDLFENNYDVYILKEYCASITGKETHNNALEILKRNIGLDKII